MQTQETDLDGLTALAALLERARTRGHDPDTALRATARDGTQALLCRCRRCDRLLALVSGGVAVAASGAHEDCTGGDDGGDRE